MSSLKIKKKTKQYKYMAQIQKGQKNLKEILFLYLSLNYPV
jgi:hypothetical protein